MNKLKLLILIGFMSSSLISVAQIESTRANTIPFQPTLNDVEYIYNRILDIMIRSKNLQGAEYITAYTKAGYENIVITIEPELSTVAISGVKCINSLSMSDLGQPIGLQNLFDRVFFLNLGEVKRKSKSIPQIFEGNEVMHVCFTDLYLFKNKLYVGVLTFKKIIDPDYFDGYNLLFEIEICHQKNLMFRKYYKTYGTGKDGYSWFEFLFDDVPCD